MTDDKEKHDPVAREGQGKESSHMRVLIITQGYYGERMVDNIKGLCPDNWEVYSYTFTTGLPALLDDPAEFLPGELPATDLLISLGEETGVAQLITDIVKMTDAKVVIAPADIRA